MLAGIIATVVLLGAVGFVIALILNFAGDKFYVQVDENIEKIRNVLPGNNCGGCGYAGCDALAAAIADGSASPGACPVGGSETINKIGEIMGVQVSDSVRMVAQVHCGGECTKTERLGSYNGPKSCVSAKMVQGNGGKACLYGCMGYGSCVEACEFDALSVKNGVAVVDKEKCRACGACIKICPNSLISLVPYDSKIFVRCSSKERGPVVKKQCSAGCIGCTLCTRECPSGAITMNGNIPQINYEICTSCGRCVEKCPSKCLVMI